MEKLIRQNINLDRDAKTRQAQPDELDRLLGQKLMEEASELSEVLHRRAPDFHPERQRAQQAMKVSIVDEAADVLETLNTILWRHGIKSPTVAARIESKRDERGGFEDRVLINAEPNHRDAQLRSLVEDCLRALVEAITGSTTKTSNTAALAGLHQRAHALDCLGTNGKTPR